MCWKATLPVPASTGEGSSSPQLWLHRLAVVRFPPFLFSPWVPLNFAHISDNSLFQISPLPAGAQQTELDASQREFQSLETQIFYPRYAAEEGEGSPRVV